MHLHCYLPNCNSLPLFRYRLELHPFEWVFRRHLNITGAQSSDPVFGSWMTTGLWTCLAASLGLRQLTPLWRKSHAPALAHTQSKGPQKFRIINKSSFSPPLSTWQQDPSVHQKRMVHLPPVLSMGILPEYIFQAPLLLRCCLNHLARNLPPELTPSNSSLMNTHLQLQGLGR